MAGSYKKKKKPFPGFCGCLPEKRKKRRLAGEILCDVKTVHTEEEQENVFVPDSSVIHQ